MTLTHLDPEGRPRMVDVSAKAPTRRRAVAAGYLALCPECAEALATGGGPKGDPWSTARIAAVLGAKRTGDLIPLAHPLPLEAVTVEHRFDPALRRAWLRAEVSLEGRTGVEMEALTAVSVGLLALYDMLKAVSHRMEVGPVRLLLKEGGRRGRIQEAWEDCPWQE
ncbi:cyclic pyranopterin monophosphate synthase MoaC [Mesoterricola sediminis]|uniref:cyclic pyranopterin monophosphate synthase n=1 Tax=Mesoterricola sediminis TaxID=2927980 RepID=A0AA48KBL7_9BACT|nr:cyclic pyranopterin monophosphate synthase MoaC [Mesoterricola sediminis]BDU75215.1 cyclic pyranopterin monophosphate synthase accessory protein [Mesoterricola sediminis]